MQHEYYAAYQDAKSRCNNPNNKSYIRYGNRGIQFKFSSFAEFLTEVGLRPVGYSLDRINNNGHYEVGNVRWASKKTQANNRRPRCDTKAHADSYIPILGISWDISRKKYLVRWKSKYIGRFNTLDEAILTLNIWISNTH